MNLDRLPANAPARDHLRKTKTTCDALRRKTITGAGLSLAIAALSVTPAAAHGFAGKRFFPATPSTEDPAVADEFAFPSVTRFGGETAISGEYAKRLFGNVALSVGGEWVRANEDGAIAKGFGNIETALRWRFLKSEDHEMLATLGLAVEWGASGSSDIGEETTVIAPSLAFGKGFGDLPESMNWARPFAVTGIIEYARPVHDLDSEGELLPTALEGGLSLQYSIPYLVSSISDRGVPSWARRLIPIVEFTFDDPVRNAGEERFSATVRPGLLYVGRKVQLGAEAIIPANDEAGDKVGFLVQLHFFIDDMFPRSLGRPLWGRNQ